MKVLFKMDWPKYQIILLIIFILNLETMGIKSCLTDLVKKIIYRVKLCKLNIHYWKKDWIITATKTHSLKMFPKIA